MLMPQLDLSKAGLTDAEMAIAVRVMNKDRLRASKPKKEEIYEHNGGRYRRNVYGEAAYVWRMLCFGLIAAHPHSCIPVTADWDVGDLTMSNDDRRARCKELDVIVRKIENTVETHKKAGLLRWHQAIHGGLPAGITEELPGISYAKV
jgi:hypothetical protein